MIVFRLDRRSRCASAAMRFAVVLTLACGGIATTPALAAPVETSTGLSELVSVREAALRFNIPELWIRAVMHAESGGNPRAVSVAGAMGVMQIMPTTWAALTARYALGDDPFDIRANIFAGTAYLRAMLDRYGDLAAALAAYNAGPARVDAWHTGNRRLPSETVAYVARIAPGSVARDDMASNPVALIPRDWRTSMLFTSHAGNVTNASGEGQLASDRAESPAFSTAVPSASRPSSDTMFVAMAEQRP